MKKFIGVCLSFSILFLSSCKDELCYDCVKDSVNYSKFCLPRKEAKDKKIQLESQGFKCSKFSQ